MGKTLFDKIWDAHVVTELDDGTSLVHLDRVFIHERTGSTALTSLKERGLPVRNPQHVFATMDHIVDTLPGRGDTTQMPGGEAFIKIMRREALDAGLADRVRTLLGEAETDALIHRVRSLLTTRTHPLPPTHRPAVPWPMW